jgi:hypothetical protein
MAESAAKIRLQELQAERRRAAYRLGQQDNSSGSSNTPAPAAKKPSTFHTGNTVSQNYRNKQAAKQAANSSPQNRGQQSMLAKGASTVGNRNTYQRHVLFAIVTAFLIKIASAGKTSLTAK